MRLKKIDDVTGGFCASSVVHKVILSMCGCLALFSLAWLGRARCTTLEHQLEVLRAEAEGAGANQLRWGDEDEFATPARGAHALRHAPTPGTTVDVCLLMYP